MPAIKPYPPRHSSDHTGNRLTITIPNRRNWSQIIFIGFWLCMWGAIGTMAGRWIVSGLTEGPESLGAILCVGPFVLLGVGMWGLVGVWAVYGLSRELTSREIITVHPDAITIRYRGLWFDFSEVYRIEHIQNLHGIPYEHHLFAYWHGWRAKPSFGPLVFHYGAQLVYFGTGVDEAEARQILALIGWHYPQYRSET